MITKGNNSVENTDGIICADCNLPLEQGDTKVNYISGAFTVTLLKCPKCGMVYISEDVATGKALEVEQSLEGK